MFYSSYILFQTILSELNPDIDYKCVNFGQQHCTLLTVLSRLENLFRLCLYFT